MPHVGPPGEHVRVGIRPSIKLALPKLRFKQRRAAISYLRAAYLAAFAAMGYAAVARQSFDLVRQQICEPDMKHVPHFFYRDDDLHEYDVVVIEEPNWASSIMVLMRNYRITLPLFDDAGLYERLAEKTAAAGVRAELRGSGTTRRHLPRPPRLAPDHTFLPSSSAIAPAAQWAQPASNQKSWTVQTLMDKGRRSV
jgi:hypothetical protein